MRGLKTAEPKKRETSQRSQHESEIIAKQIFWLESLQRKVSHEDQYVPFSKEAVLLQPPTTQRPGILERASRFHSFALAKENIRFPP